MPKKMIKRLMPDHQTIKTNKYTNNQMYVQTITTKPCESACPVPIATYDHVVKFMNMIMAEM